MQRIVKFPLLVLLFTFLLSMNSTQLSSQLYFTTNTQDSASYGTSAGMVKEDSVSTPSPAPVLGAYSEEQAATVVDPYQVYSYDQMIKDAEALRKLYPDIIKTETLADTSDGRKILLIKLGKGSKKITLNGSHHAREYITSTLLMKMVEEYAYSYKKGIPFKGYNVRQILDQATIYFVPMVNPDGVSLVQFGASQSQDSNKVLSINGNKKSFKSWKANGRGVDLNYQYPYGWEQLRKLKGPSSEGYKGTSPATEIETKAMMKLTTENPFLIHAAYHTQGEIIYWYNEQKGTFYDQCLKIANKLSKVTGYRLLSVADQKRSFGGYKDWTVTTFKKPGFTIEVCPYVGNFPYPDKWFNDVWNKSGTTGLLFAQEAMGMVGYDYEVYKGSTLVQLFNNKDDAVGFAKKYGFTEVRNHGKSLWKM